MTVSSSAPGLTERGRVDRRRHRLHRGKDLLREQPETFLRLGFRHPAVEEVDDDHLQADRLLQRSDLLDDLVPVHRPFKMPGWPVRVDWKATRVTSSPMLGEHTDQVLSDWLGLTAQAVAEMKREGVI